MPAMQAYGAPYTKIVAVVVGVSKYKQAGAWASVPNAEPDAKAFAKVMKEHGAEVIPLYGRRATRDGIWSALEKAEAKLKRVSGTSRKTLLVFYFAGHGKTISDQGYIVPFDGGQATRRSWIPMSNLEQFSQEVWAAQHQLFVFASCFSGTALLGDRGKLDPSDLASRRPAAEWLARALKQLARVVITAGDASEAIPDGPKGHGSEFGNAVVGALEKDYGSSYDKADWNRDGCVSSAELFAYAQNYGRTTRNSPRTGRFPGGSQGEVALCRGRIQDVMITPGEGPDRGERSWAAAAGRDQYGRWADIRVGGATVRLRYVAPGSFTMGSPVSEEGRFDNETQHEVMLTRGYWLGETEVTQAVWKAVMKGNPSRFKGDDLPVEGVSWKDVQEFLTRLNGLVPGLDARLPTEAEWEYAARGGSSGARYGSLDEVAWHKGNSGRKTHGVCGGRRNSWGFCDMLGNVWEWCSDWYDAYPIGGVVDPSGPGTGSARVIRGGSWDSDARGVRTAGRDRVDPGSRLNSLGFRMSRGQ